MKSLRTLALGAALVLGAATLYQWGVKNGQEGASSGWVGTANAANAEQRAGASELDVYYPGTEELAPDEMRVIACGTGMPMPRL